MRAQIAVMVGLLLCSPVRADNAQVPERSDRLVTLARVWAEAKFFHPGLQTKNIDWDGALVAALELATKGR